MSFFDFIVAVYNSGDMERLEKLIHEDFLFMKDYSIQNREEYLEDVQNLFNKGIKMHKPTLIVENEDIVALNHIVVDDAGNTFRVTAVNFIKDGKSWRITTSRTKI